ncbi:MAG TPA: response regulator transcription factor [Bacteroidia bacterium]|jgi:two-component system response regulator DegU|nr:response regulator transcription factor [Bacteroidia bacterium]
MEQAIKISIVDDHPAFRKGLISLLEELPHFKLFSEANNGKEFIHSMNGDFPNIVLLDLEMPEMDGIETTKYLKQHFPQIKILIITMHNDESWAMELMKVGIHGFLVKNSSLEEISNAITSVMSLGYYLNEFITYETLKNLVNGKFIKPKFKQALLNETEQRIICMMCKQYISKEIAEVLSLNIRTIDFHRKQIIRKINARNSNGVIVYGLENGLHKKYPYKPKKK